MNQLQLSLDADDAYMEQVAIWLSISQEYCESSWQISCTLCNLQVQYNEEKCRKSIYTKILLTSLLSTSQKMLFSTGML